MRLLVNRGLRKSLKGKYIFLDSDFLGKIFKDEEVFKESIYIFSFGFLLLDPLVEFEFLRDIFVPKERIIREEFIAQPIFLPIGKRQEVFIKIQENALLLSKIYAHKGVKSCSLTDLFLAGRLMLNEDLYTLVTGNKKDFPSCVFDVAGVINLEEGESGKMRAFCVVVFNKKKFEGCYSELQELEKRHKEQLVQDAETLNTECPF